MYKAILLLFIICTFSAKGQSVDSLVGIWKFKDVNHAELMDSSKLSNFKLAFRDLQIHLKSDKSYSAIFFQKEEGTWSYVDNVKTIIFKSEKGENKIKVISITAKNLILELKRGSEIIFEKITSE